MERKPVNFEGSVDTVLPSKPHWYRFFLLGFVFFAARSSFASYGIAGIFFGMSLAAEPVMLEEEIISVFQKLSEQSQNDADRLYDYGVVLRQFGFHSQALRVQREGQVLDASNPRTKQEIASLEKILLLQRERE